jgi:hypothetical protein
MKKTKHQLGFFLRGMVLISGATLLVAGPSEAALSVTASTAADAMAAALLGPGVKLVAGSATYTGAADASGFFTGDTTIFGNPSGVDGVLFTSGSVTNALPPNNSSSATLANGAAGSAYLSSLIGGAQTFNASTLSFKITVDPDVSAVEWTYVFGSEEYNEYVNSSFNDVFALSLDGTNLALIPGTSTPVSINNVNNGNPVGSGTISNPAFYRNNSPGSNAGGVPGPYETQYDGLTTVLKSVATGLKPGVEYNLLFAVADTSDTVLDSGVFLKGGSVKRAEEEVPAPLPLLGAGAALAWSRRLRSRISSKRFQMA